MSVMLNTIEPSREKLSTNQEVVDFITSVLKRTVEELEDASKNNLSRAEVQDYKELGTVVGMLVAESAKSGKFGMPLNYVCVCFILSLHSVT
jgi:hypothetical protein